MFQFPGFALILLFDSENKSFIQKTENGEHKTDIAIRPLSSVLRLPEVGFPIRKFPDQSLFAAPRDLSQRTTSFIASQRQGIHRTPFWHLIMLEIRKRTPGIPFTPPTPVSSDSKRPVLLQTHPGSLRSGSDHDWLLRHGKWPQASANKRSPLRRRRASFFRQTGCASSSQCQFFQEIDAQA
jgi:hypothetical protein